MRCVTDVLRELDTLPVLYMAVSTIIREVPVKHIELQRNVFTMKCLLCEIQLHILCLNMCLLSMSMCLCLLSLSLPCLCLCVQERERERVMEREIEDGNHKETC